MRFAFIILIGEHYEHMVSSFVCSFFQDIHGSFVFHFVSSSYLSWNFNFLSCHVSLLSLSLVG